MRAQRGIARLAAASLAALLTAGLALPQTTTPSPAAVQAPARSSTTTQAPARVAPGSPQFVRPPPELVRAMSVRQAGCGPTIGLARTRALIGDEPARAQVEARYCAGRGSPPLKLLVWSGIGHVDQGYPYVDGPIAVDWTRKDLNWRFKLEGHIASDASRRGPVLLRWELSRTPFPAWSTWKPAPGFSAWGSVDGRPEFVVNLAPLAPRPPDWPTVARASVSTTGTVKATTVLKPPAGTTGGSASATGMPPSAQNTTTSVLRRRSADASPVSPIPSDITRGPGDAPPGGNSAVTRAGDFTVAPLTEAQLARLTAAMPALRSLYLRVVPVDSAGNPIGRPTRTVELRFGPVEKQPEFKFTINWPTVKVIGYRPVRAYDFDWQCHVVAAHDIKVPWPGGSPQTIVAKGAKRNACEKKDSSLLDDIVDTFGSFVELVEGFTNWVSDTYASLKSTLISAVASAIPGCGDSPTCKGALEAGLNAGLAAIGMPPDLPDFDQLQAMGEGYLVDMVAQQAAQSGVPFSEDATRAALKEMIKQGKEAMSGGSSSGDWIPDDSRRYKPMLLTMEVSNTLPDGAMTTAVDLTLAETGSARYRSQRVPIPRLAAGKSYRLAVALEPTSDPGAWMDLLPTAQDIKMFDMSGYFAKQDQAKAAWSSWKSTYTTGPDIKLKGDMRPQFGASTGYKIAFD